mmetsp:Transcript_148/g.380  ORF Transcript_148/g.380 Transcript_148/m.380 type:complete len:86 (+) Transcript_148:1255-1512(+)
MLAHLLYNSHALFPSSSLQTHLLSFGAHLQQLFIIFPTIVGIFALTQDYCSNSLSTSPYATEYLPHGKRTILVALIGDICTLSPT